jgi:hypothetical protein
MKKLILIITMVLVATYFSFGQDEEKSRKEDPKFHYCAKLKDGKIMMMKDGVEMTNDITTASGVKIRTDGTIIKPDGFMVMLNDGECADDLGNVFPPKEKIRAKDIEEKKKGSDEDPRKR